MIEFKTSPTVVAEDTCGAPEIVLTAVSSDEPDNARGGGDGNTRNDIQDAATGTPDYEVKLRAERAATGDGRTYTLVYTATDASGNESSASARVLVPHDGRKTD